MNNLPKLIGERIRFFRKEKGYSQEELAHRAGVHSTYIGQIERGEKNASLYSISSIVSALEITFEDLFQYLKGRENSGNNPIFMEIVNKLQFRSIKEQERILKIIDLFFDQKDEKGRH